MHFSKFKALQQYQGTGLGGVVESANPVEVIRLLLDGFLDRVAAAEGYIRLGDITGKAEAIAKAYSIIDGLRCSVDLEAGGELAQRLDALYEYVQMRLFEANVASDLEVLAECRRLVGEVRDGWVQANCATPTQVSSDAA